MAIHKCISILFSVALAMVTMFLFVHCTPKLQSLATTTPAINTAHLDALYQEIKVNGHDVGIVHIYSEYPDYHWVGDQDEGIACVDDASRAAIFYMRQYKKTSSPEYLHKATMLLRFLMEMQTPNGYFYNFIWPDGSINKTGRTSNAIPTWWSWRSLWSIGEAIKILGHDDALVPELTQHRNALLNAMLREKSFFSTKTDTAGGFGIPTWLPGGAATDQASIILMGLSLAHQQKVFNHNHPKRDSVTLLMDQMADGIMMMQVNDPGSFSDGAFLSWNNLWHAYANVQSYALLMAGETLHDHHMTVHALYEINTFYPALFEKGYLESFWVRESKGKSSTYQMKPFPQIAYGVCPMVLACAKAFELTHDDKYKIQSVQIAAWFSGQNQAHVPMFDPVTGLGFDGIVKADQINKNSGAESTIESLLALQAIEHLGK